MDCQCSICAELYGLHDNGHRALHSQSVESEGFSVVHIDSVVGAVVGLVFSFRLVDLRCGDEHGLQSSLTARRKGFQGMEDPNLDSVYGADGSWILHAICLGCVEARRGEW